jgi:hypothetical protein
MNAAGAAAPAGADGLAVPAAVWTAVLGAALALAGGVLELLLQPASRQLTAAAAVSASTDCRMTFPLAPASIRTSEHPGA